MRVTAVIPARFASTRFPGKPLADLLGKPMVQWVYERTARSGQIDRVIVATDDERIYQAVRGFGGEVQMTRADHPTGTDRLAEVAAQIDTDLVVNVQGDEPLIVPRMIDQAVLPLKKNPGIPMGTLKTPIRSMEEYRNPNVVKVVVDSRDFALYFSRAAIPHARDGEQGFHISPPFKHVGLYVYRKDFLLTYAKLPPTPLELLENLEQLRALEHGFRIKVTKTDFLSQGVDTPDDLELARLALQAEGIK
jgi:3-deoxy-manno-octulosonate cytidylyltransferase (CMP-KDO synthetase)